MSTRELGDFGGKCPACGHPFGVPPEQVGMVFPSFRLEVCDNDGSQAEWRLSLFGVNRWWVSDGFSPTASATRTGCAATATCSSSTPGSTAATRPRSGGCSASRWPRRWAASRRARATCCCGR
ncbi:hypothetical protein ACFQV2_26410 [Actinokineospora soli]|uniref:Uncharacterized protein n=1 Tax=Actinokineospora soli TaxID=1048753 RepID=A0ABW2TVK1_9PSEU